MFVVTSSLTIGQLTFILRVILQILSLTGPFLIGLLILSHTPRIASFSTHDVLSRIVGSQSANQLSVKWIWNYMRGGNRDPVRSSRLPIAVALLVLYGLFASINDIGFLGLYTCSVPAPAERKMDYPASIGDFSSAQAAISSSFLNGVDINVIDAYRCDSSADTPIADLILKACTAWRNSTWADASLFTDVNTTDSDMLIPRRITTAIGFNLTSYYADTGPTRVEKPTIQGGILVNPHDIGVQAIFGVPQLSPNQTVTLNKAMALEIETGCIALGLRASMLADDINDTGSDGYLTNGTWSKYSGPDILYDPLFQVGSQIRKYWEPAFNLSNINSNGTVVNDNSTTNEFYSRSINVREVRLPDFNGTMNTTLWASWFEGNCTDLVKQKIGLPADGSDRSSCSLLGLNGDIEVVGQIFGAQMHYLCASTSQLNMVSTTIRSDEQGSVTIDKFTRLPSDLNHLTAEYWQVSQADDIRLYTTYDPLQRFTLSDNKDGPTSHYLYQEDPTGGQSQNGTLVITQYRPVGPVNAGSALTKAGSRSILLQTLFNPAYASIQELGPLPGDADENLKNPATLSRWTGQVAASFILASLQYNGWAALAQPPVLVTTQNDQLAICYHPAYALGFLPLVLAAMLVGSWFVGILVTTSIRGLRELKELYGGLYPSWRAVRPDLKSEDMFMIWRRQAGQTSQQGKHSQSGVRSDSSSGLATGTVTSTDDLVPVRLDVIDTNDLAIPVEMIRKGNPRAVDYIAAPAASSAPNTSELEQESGFVRYKDDETPMTDLDQSPLSGVKESLMIPGNQQQNTKH